MIVLGGAGPGNPDLLTFEVKREIENAERVIAFGRIKESLKDIRSDIIEIQRTSDLLEFLDDGEDALILASGDPCFFGISDLLMRKGIKLDKILPGISSLQYFSSVLKVSTSDASVKSFHGREIDFSDMKGRKFFFFTDSINTPSKISEELKNKGYSGDFFAGYNLSYNDEEIVKIRIGEKLPDKDKVSVVMAVLDEDIE